MKLPARAAARCYRATFELAPVDIAHLAPDGTFLWVNQRLCDMMGYTPAELVGSPVQDVTDPQFLQADQAYIRALLAGERASYAVEKRYLRKDGAAVWVNLTVSLVRAEDGQPAFFIAVLEDIAERKGFEAERTKLLERAGQLEATFEAIADGILVYDKQGSIVRSNAAARSLLELNAFPPGFLATPIADRLATFQPRDRHARPLPFERTPLARVLSGETLTAHGAPDVLYHLPSGADGLMSVSGAPVRDDRAEIVGAVCVYRDVTERGRLEDERAQMLSIVSHELRSPLTSLKVRTQVLRRALERKRAAEARNLQAIEFDIERITRLVNDLVEVSRFERNTVPLHFEHCDLAQLCRQAADEQMAASGRPVTLTLPDEPVELEADGARIGQVLSNLLSNALKYSPTQAPVEVHLRRERDEAVVSVRDEGPGIPLEVQPHLFERFYRVPGVRVQHGSAVSLGLGLYICQALVERHGSRIGVRSEPGQGATFWFRLPLAQTQD
jgi:PAS domain S-box-containing protein